MYQRGLWYLWVVFFFTLISSTIFYAEVPFAAIKGFDFAVNNPKFSPVLGYAAYYGKVVEKLRFCGNYGQLPSDITPGSDVVSKRAQLWRHPSFKPGKDDSVEKKESKSWQYPYDAISALVQWLFPSPAGAVLIANTRTDDPVGDLAHDHVKLANLLEAIANFETEEKFKVEILPLFNKISDDLHLESSEAAAKSAEASNSTKMQQYQERIRELQSKERRSAKDEKQLVLVKEQKEKLEQQIAQSAEKDLKSRVAKLKNERTVFVDILYQALVDDGTFKSGAQEETKHEEQCLYPTGIALHALLAYIWVICQDKASLRKIYQNALLLKPAFKLRSTPSSIVKEFEASVYTESDYIRIKQQLKQDGQWNREEAAFAGYAYNVYETEYPDTLLHSWAYGYQDCNETAYRNVFCFLLYDEKTRSFDANRLDSLICPAKLLQIKKFFTTYSTPELQRNPVTHNAWASILIGLNDLPGPYIAYGDHGTEVLTHDITEFVNMFAKLTQNEILCNRTGVKFAEKLDVLCELFTACRGSGNEHKKMSWRMSDGSKNIISIEAPFYFCVGGSPVFTMRFIGTGGHMDFTYVLGAQTDWRNEVELNDNTLEGLLYAFFDRYKDLPEIKMLFLRKFSYQAKKIIKEHMLEGRALDSLLRMIIQSLYKKNGRNKRTEFFQESIAKDLLVYLPSTKEAVHELWSDPIIVSFMKYIQPDLYFYDGKFIPYFKKFNLGQEHINDLHGVEKETTLIKVCKSRSSRVTDLQDILSLHSDVNIQDKSGRSAVFYLNEKSDLLAVLLQVQGLNLEIVDSFGNTALMSFIKDVYTFEKCIEMLISAGADIYFKKLNGNSILEEAQLRRRTKIITLIESLMSEKESKTDLAAKKIQSFVRSKKSLNAAIAIA